MGELCYVAIGTSTKSSTLAVPILFLQAISLNGWLWKENDGLDSRTASANTFVLVVFLKNLTIYTSGFHNSIASANVLSLAVSLS
jgi:hypothetical protein